MGKSRRSRSRKRRRSRKGGNAYTDMLAKKAAQKQAALKEKAASSLAAAGQGKLKQASVLYKKAGEQVKKAGLPSHCKPGQPLAASKTCKDLAAAAGQVSTAGTTLAKKWATVKTPTTFRGALGGKRKKRRTKRRRKKRKSRKSKRKKRRSKRRRKSKRRKSRKRRR